MLAPKRAKFRKHFRGTMGGVAQRGTTLSFGDYALKAEAAGWIASRQIEAARRVMSHYTRRGGRIWIRIFPDKPITHKPSETGMGGGKGDVVGYVAVVRPGRILFEMGGVTKETAQEAMRLAAQKLPLATRIISRK